MQGQKKYIVMTKEKKEAEITKEGIGKREGRNGNGKGGEERRSVSEGREGEK